VFHSNDNMPKAVKEGADIAVNLPIRTLATLIWLSGIVIAPDSGLMHMAAATETPCLALFGPTDPRTTLEHYPLARYMWAVDELPHYTCQKPCWGNTARNFPQPGCSLDHTTCMSILHSKDIIEQSERLLSDMFIHNQNRMGTLQGKPIIGDVARGAISTATADVLMYMPKDCGDLREPIMAERMPR